MKHTKGELLLLNKELLEALQELVDIVEDIREGNYIPDSFTLSTANQAIKKQQKSENNQKCKAEITGDTCTIVELIK